MVNITFPKDIWDFCDVGSCSESYSVPVSITGLSPNNFYTIVGEAITVQYFNNVIGTISVEENSFYITSNNFVGNIDIKAIGVKTAIVKISIKNSLGQVVGTEMIMIRCPSCNQETQKPEEEFTIKLDSSNLLIKDDQIEVNCQEIINIAAIAEKLVPGRKYRYSFRSFPSSEILFSNASGEFYAGSEITQNFNTLIFVGSGVTKPPKFFMVFELTDLTTNTTKRTDIYSMTCIGSCGILPDSVDIDLDMFFDETPVRIYTLSFRDTNALSDILVNKNNLTLNNIRYQNILSQNNILDLEQINDYTIGINLLNSNLIIDDLNSIKFYLKIDIPNYMASGKNFILTEKTNTNLIIDLVDLDNLPDSATTDNKVVSTDPFGAIQDTVVLSCPASSTKPETCSITIPSGTVFTSSDGNILRGNISLQAVHFSNEAESSLRAFPGGADISAYIDENNNLVQEDAVFYTYGFFTVEAKDDNNNIASSLSQLAIISADINPNSQSTDPSDVNTIKDGDLIPIWSLDSNTGVWKIENHVPYMFGQVSTAVNHFSMWNFDSKSPDTCTVLKIPFPESVVRDYISQINTTGLWMRQVNNIAGAINGNYAVKSDPRELVINISNFPKRFNGKVNVAQFDFYLTRQDATAKTNSIGSVTYSNNTSGRSRCDCISSDCFSATPTPTPTSTRVPVEPSPTPTSQQPTPTPTMTPTTSITPSITPTNTGTPTSTPTSTPTPTLTPTQTPLPIGSSDT